MRIKNPILINAAEMSRQHPKTFGRPPRDQLDAITPGHFAKVAIDCDLFEGECGGERFWVQVEKCCGDVMIGRVDNVLVTKRLKYNDRIRFARDNVYDLAPPNEDEAATPPLLARGGLLL